MNFMKSKKKKKKLKERNDIKVSNKIAQFKTVNATKKDDYPPNETEMKK